MRGVPLSMLRRELKAEINQSMVTGVAPQGDARLNQMLSNRQQWLASEFNWPFLEHRWDITVPSGVRYAALPTIADNQDAVAINFERPVRVQIKYQTTWQDIDYGVDSDQYNYRDSDLGQGQDPIERWRFYTNLDEATTPNQIEVWPIPVSPSLVRFTGQRVCYVLMSDDDRADLDDMLLVYYTAADIVTKEADRQEKMKLASDRLRQVMQVAPTKYERLVLGQNMLDRFRRSRRLVPITTAGMSASTVSPPK